MALGAPPRVQSDRGWCLVVPARLHGALPLELEALLPNRRHNDDLMAGLQPSICAESDRSGAIAAVFAADPFINVRQMTSVLARVGIERVANFPSVTQYGKAFEQSLSEVGLGVQRELAILAQFRKLGLQTYQTLAEHPVAGFDPHGHAGFLITISFDDMECGNASEELLRARQRWALPRVDPKQLTLVSRPPVREAVEGDRGSIVIWPLD